MFRTILLAAYLVVAGQVRAKEPKSGPPVGQPPEGAFNIETKKPEDRVKVQVERDSATFEISSKSGIGGAQISSAKDAWPTTVTVRLHLRGLEWVAISGGMHKLTGSVLSHSDNAATLHLSEEGKKGERDAGTSIKTFNSAGKPIKGLPGEGGYFEISLPKALLEGKVKKLNVDWIDFYR